ncbi:MAG: hypothetical protein MAG795_01068 [Candidatus Woesearchaeota archaeon]|nr:hypothetical protein [Candidatus Woesearchaeota archaeon]
MIVKLLSLGDLIAALVAFTVSLNPELIPGKLVFYVIAYLIVKGGLFALMGNFISYFDIASGIYIIALTKGFSVPLLTFIVVLFLVQKNIFAFI